MKPVITILLLTTLFANAQRNVTPPHSRMIVKSPIKKQQVSLADEKVQSNLLSMLKSQTKSRRAGAYLAVRSKFKEGSLKNEDRRDYRAILKTALDYHLQSLLYAVVDLKAAVNTFNSFNKSYGQWYISALNTREMCQTDWRRVQFSGKSFKSMNFELGEASKKFADITADHTSIKASRDFKILIDTSDAINECREEIAWCDGETDFIKTTLNRMVTSIPDGARFKETLDRFDSVTKQLDEYNVVAKHNNSQEWASKEIKRFASILNARRLSIGLRPLKLDKVLSETCKAHSKDMVDRGFFDHTGSDGSDFEKRAEAVEWYGGVYGEAIYSGSDSAATVHREWWKSEDNRPKLYTESLNRIGIGVIDSTWTVVVGSTYNQEPEHYIVE